ncbi:heme-binding beta-barrel domain-containing protein [Planctomicrobium sp. SH664]|uniref:heme-binding beta-barrel domain-containing protein n=1 Tax=Planctomicrobium sp. SH664 TaxID=3448125 RepID=UPI003F5C7BC1
MTEPRDDWGPLEALIGTWAGESTHRSDQGVTKALEIRSFERRPAIYNHLENQWAYPISYTLRVVDSISLETQLYEESGYWLWAPLTNQIFQLSVIPFGTCLSCRSELTQIRGKYAATLIASGETIDGGILNIGSTNRPLSMTRQETRIVFDENELKFERMTTMLVPGRGLVEFHDVGELQRGRRSAANRKHVLHTAH